MDGRKALASAGVVAAQCWSSSYMVLEQRLHGAGATLVIPHIQGQRRSPGKMVGGAKSPLESNPKPARDAQKSQTNLVHTRTQRPHRDRDRTVFECLLWRYRSSVDCRRGRGSGCSRLGYDGISPTWRRSPLTPPQSCKNLHRTWKQTFGGSKQNLGHTRIQEKGAVTPTRD